MTQYATVIDNDCDLSPVDVARLMGVSKQTVHNWINGGKLRAYRPSPRIVRVRREDLEELRSRTTQQQ